MIVYEVTATVREDLGEMYERYMLDRHIPEVLATGACTGASFERGEGESYRVRYFSATRETLDSYFANNAPVLRRDFAEHFPDGVDLARAEWVVLRHLA